ncbi:hypothetical protein AB0C76_18255 [Kitasatospora sp. NPDC048722]|uniref:response regulator transcription factor n=1 Tax=Kitasatospora sp. NPDC048722 TaxID=3155639 RepID=UPI0033D48752
MTASCTGTPALTSADVNTRAPAPVAVLIADDDEVTRSGLRVLLSARPGIAVVGEAADGVEALTKLGAQNRTHAVVIAYESGLVVPGFAG